MKRKALGKGLSALLPEAESRPAPSGSERELPIDQIEPNPRQPRTRIDPATLAELAESIRHNGVVQPILVRPADGEGSYELIAGERRWRAARRAGLDTIPAIVRTADELASLEQAVVENLHRADLNAMEEAAAYQQLIEEFDLTHEQAAARVGKSRVAVTNSLRLFQLPASLQRMVADGQLTGGHAKALKSVVRGARTAVAKDRQVVIFPEGTRQPIGAAPDYKPGIAAMYKDLNIPVTPVALNTGLIWQPKGIMRSPGRVTIKILPPIPAGLSREDFMRELETRIEICSSAITCRSSATIFAVRAFKAS